MPIVLSPPEVSIVKTSVALYLSGSVALKLDVESPGAGLTLAFVFAGAVFAFRFAFELLVFVTG
jgi:hypothetical protein